MTIEEAKKIIEMCVDAVKKGDGDDAKIYVNKEYVLSILDMVESTSQGLQPGIEPINPPTWPPTWPQVWYKDYTDLKYHNEGTDRTDMGQGFERVPWWVWYKNPMGNFTCDVNSTGSKPQDADVVMNSSETTDPLKNTANPGFVNVTDKDFQASSDDLKRLHEYQNSNKTVDVSPKRTDYLDDWAGGSTTGGGGFNYSMDSIPYDSSNRYCNC